MSPRAAAKRAFLDAAGWSGAEVASLAGDASNRRYDRVSGGPGGARAVLMDAPAERGEEIGVFLAFSAHLRALGYSAPEVYEADLAGGWALIEDLGDDLYAHVALRRPPAEREIYEAAIDLLADLARQPPPAEVRGSGASAKVAPYDDDVLSREAMLALDWWRAGLEGSPSADLTAEFDALIRAACAGPAARRDVLTLRDYHAENLIWLPERGGLARVGLLDYQDALAGAPEYDLVSLLEDARRDVSPDLAAAMRARHAAALGLGRAAAAEAAAAYAALGAQRNLKIVGIFARLARRDGKPAYLSLIPRVWDHLQGDLEHPGLAGLAAFVRRWIPEPTAERLARLDAP